MQIAVLTLLVALAGSSVGRAAEANALALRPTSVDQFYVEPGAPARLTWNVADGAEALEFRICDTWGRQEEAGKAAVTGGVATVDVALPRGYHEIEFPAAGRRYGIVALPPAGDKDDAFFAIDAALSWLVKDESVREGLVKGLRRSGVRMSRERVSWGQVNPGKDRYQWDDGGRYDTLRQLYARHGVRVLEMFHDAPSYLGVSGRYPVDLIGAAEGAGRMTRQWQATWGALEIWNEPEIQFGAEYPADQYVSLLKALLFGAERERLAVPVVAGVFAHYLEEYVTCAARNGLLQCADAISFHTYERAERMEQIVAAYRGWLKTSGQEEKPLWITECGRPWRRGPDRPPLAEDRESALDITMKAIEAKACGISRYFPFVYPYYEENDNNFGMACRAGSPLASMAAYAQAVAALGGMEYVGDLDTGTAEVRRARIFQGGERTVAVIYTGKVAADAAVKLPVPVLAVAGIDGRPLGHNAAGAVPIADGLAYVTLDKATLGDRTRRDTEAMRLWQAGRRPLHAARTPAAPVFLRFEFDRAALSPEPCGYAVAEGRNDRVPLRVRVFNASTAAFDSVVSVELPPGAALMGGTARLPVKAEARSHTDVVWEVDLRRVIARGEWSSMQFTVSAGGGANVLPLLINIRGVSALPDVLESSSRTTRLAIDETASWRPNIAGGGDMTMARTGEGAWRLEANFGDGDRWVYPTFTLPDGVDLSAARALAIRARCLDPADVRVILWEGTRNVGYLTSRSIIPADGAWHVAVVAFESLSLSGANDPDPNGKLDLGAVRRLSIGMNAKERHAVLDVSAVYVLGR